MTKKEHRKSKRVLVKLQTMLTGPEKVRLKNARRKTSNVYAKKEESRTGIKQWILEKQPERIAEMFELGLLKS